jgi:poly-beta-1,6-N-acetyl-D-glucosamine synthase
VFRLAVPYAMVVALVASLCAETPVVLALGALQVLFYLAAAMGTRSPAWRRNKLVAFATVFVELNWTAMQAGLQFATGKLDFQWEKT